MKFFRISVIIKKVVIIGLFSFVLTHGHTLLSAQKMLRKIHVFVALCDNENQGIVPVPEFLGNGEDPGRNLYWGAMYGVKTYLVREGGWDLLIIEENPTEEIVERCILKHCSSNVYICADAYRGKEIKNAVLDFLKSASGTYIGHASFVDSSQKLIEFGGDSDLVAYVGHNGLMDFQLSDHPEGIRQDSCDAIVLSCLSKSYFERPLHAARARPLLWTNGLMAPEAYTLAGVLEGWILGEIKKDIHLRAAKAYHKYQNCSLNAAKRLFSSGW